jgi:hypothetical protein
MLKPPRPQLLRRCIAIIDINLSLSFGLHTLVENRLVVIRKKRAHLAALKMIMSW